MPAKILLALALCALPTAAQETDPFRRLVPESAALAAVARNFLFTEGPAVDSAGILHFTDLRRGQILRLSPGGEPEVLYTDLQARANGLFFDASGRLLACEGGLGRVTRRRADGTLEVLAALFAGERLNSPNDLVVAPDGSAYFTDPFFGSRERQPQPVQGVYRIAPDGGLSLVADDLGRPNGIMLSADGRTLFVADDGFGGVRAYAVGADGSLSDGRLFAAMEGIVDGMTLDVEGHLYVAGGRGESTGVWVFSPEGARLGIIPVPEQTTNCTFSGHTLYITAATTVYSIELGVPGPGYSPTAVRPSSWGRVKSEK